MKTTVIIVSILIACACSRHDAPTSPSTRDHDPWTNTTLAQRLAILDGGQFVGDDDVKSARYRSLLTQLDGKYIENQQQIANMTLTAHKLLRDKGIEESPLTIMEGVNRLYFNLSHTNEQYANIAGMYSMLRDKGMKHDEALDGMQEIIQGVGLAP